MESTYNIKAVIEYDGTLFHGWQKQQELRTVQGELEKALSRILQQTVSLNGSGRTDAGVHAICQVANFHTMKQVELRELCSGINSLIGEDIRVRSLEFVPEDFHARFSARSRTYQYLLGTDERCKAPFCSKYIWYVGKLFDRTSIERASESLLGEKNFVNLSKNDSERDNFISTVYDLQLRQWQLGYLFEVRANRFLPQMVRRIVGILVAIGKGDIPPETTEELTREDIASSTHGRIQMAPAKGLFLTGVEYDNDQVGSEAESAEWNWRYLNEILY
ncbi:MAG: tRNA pseudouridine(38-40) synthase TruA [Candidatus Glassbacteria bacterium]